MRLLVVMSRYPFPPMIGSDIVANKSLKYLSKRNAIDFIGLEPMEGVSQSPEYVQSVNLVNQKGPSKLAMRMQYLRGFFMGTPFLVNSLAARQMKEKISEAIKLKKYDAILLFEMSAIQYCPPSCYKKMIVNIEDPLSIKLCRMSALQVWTWGRRIRLLALAKFVEIFERRFLSRMAKVFLLSESDLYDMREEGGYKNLSYMPYGVEPRDSTEIAGYGQRERAIIFSGNMYHPPNVDGLLFFLRKIFPLVLQEYPPALLWIVGAKPDDRIYEAVAKFGMHVVITGRVDDIAGYIKRASVSICPVKLKIGVQTKILEALSWGTPVVTTSEGNSGIGGISGTHFWVEDDPLLFAHKIVELLQGYRWETLSEEGIKLVSERFSWEGSVAQLEQQIESWVTSNQL